MKKLGNLLWTILFILYIAALLTITVLRPWNGAYHLLGGSLNLRVFIGYIPILRNDLPQFLYLFLGNLLWFVPFGFYLTYCRQLPAPRSILLGFLLSLLIEAGQYLLGTGTSEIDDLILNTLGCGLGVFLGTRSHHTLANLVIWALLLAGYFLLPRLIIDTGSGITVLLIILPILVFVLSAAYCGVNGFQWLFSLSAALLFLPSIFLYYNDSAAVYAVIWGLASLLGQGVGALFRSLTHHNKKGARK